MTIQSLQHKYYFIYRSLEKSDFFKQAIQECKFAIRNEIINLQKKALHSPIIPISKFQCTNNEPLENTVCQICQLIDLYYDISTVALYNFLTLKIKNQLYTNLDSVIHKYSVDDSVAEYFKETLYQFFRQDYIPDINFVEYLFIHHLKNGNKSNATIETTFLLTDTVEYNLINRIFVKEISKINHFNMHIGSVL